MPNLNRVFLMGHLTRDPEVKSTTGGQAVCKFGLAVNRHWTGSDGSKKEDTTFVDCEAWGKTGEAIGRYMAKGRPLFVEGRLKQDQWQDKESGQNRTKMGVVVEAFQFVDGKPAAQVEAKPGKDSESPGHDPSIPF